MLEQVPIGPGIADGIGRRPPFPQGDLLGQLEGQGRAVQPGRARVEHQLGPRGHLLDGDRIFRLRDDRRQSWAGGRPAPIIPSTQARTRAGARRTAQPEASAQQSDGQLRHVEDIVAVGTFDPFIDQALRRYGCSGSTSPTTSRIPRRTSQRNAAVRRWPSSRTETTIVPRPSPSSAVTSDRDDPAGGMARGGRELGLVPHDREGGQRRRSPSTGPDRQGRRSGSSSTPSSVRARSSFGSASRAAVRVAGSGDEPSSRSSVRTPGRSR